MSSALTFLARTPLALSVGRLWRQASRGEPEVEGRPAMTSLREDATLRIVPGKAGATVHCDAGTLLVTQAGDPSDHVLGPGGEVHVVGRGLVVAWALSDATITVQRPSQGPGPLAARACTAPPWRPVPATGGYGDASPCKGPRAPHPG